MKENKRFFGILLCGVLLAGFFVSCKNQKAPVNEFGFYEDLEAACQTAKKENKRILLYVSLEGLDEYSKDFRQNILETPDYKDLFEDEFVSVYFDFGESSLAKTKITPEDDEKTVEQAQKFMEQVQKNVTKVRLFNVTETPVVYLMTEDGYVISDESFNESFSDVQSFSNLIRQHENEFIAMEEMVEAAKQGSAVERVNAIYEIYKNTPEDYEYSLAELYKSAALIDKKNETGYVSELYMTGAYLESMNHMAGSDYMNASKVLKDAAATGYLVGEEKQNAYYMAAELLIMGNSEDTQTVLSYLNAAVLADPESEAADKIREEINIITSYLSGELKFDEFGNVVEEE
ncbi:MAG: hypothetical protein HUK25_08915 [Treponema sp.]|nr:hypothetical protein [Treponema sp.]